MDLKEITDLIAVRNYIYNSTQNMNIDRAASNYLNHSLIMIDKKILGLLQSVQFKEYIDFKNSKEAVKEFVKAKFPVP